MRAALALILAVSPATAAAQGANTQAAIERGLYLTRVGDCAACHTVEEEKPYAGDFELPTPFGNIYTSNLTPDPETGLGLWTADDFYRAMHEGIGDEGERLYPAFPYTHFTIVTREDSDAIFAYLQTLEPVRQIVREPDFPWPLSNRTALAGWNLINFEPQPFEPNADKSEAWNRGKYLVEGLAHCSGCHSPRDLTGAEKEGAEAYTGGHAEGWYAPSLRAGNEGEGIGEWSEAALVDYLRYGRNDHSAAFGPMAEVIQKSTQYLEEDDARAIAVYLKDLPDKPEEVEARPEPISQDDPAMQLGQTIYATQCSACHGPEGEGVPGLFAPLAGSSLTHAADPITVIRLIYEGGRSAVTDRYPTPHAMPPFGWKLDDEELAAVTTYIRNSFGNAAPAVEPGAVAELREE